MKKAILIISIILMVIVLVQSWLVGLGGTMFNDQVLSLGGLIGRLVALLFGAGAAFIMPKPLVSLYIYLGGGALAIIFGIYTGYYDMILWGGLSLALGGGSYYIWHLEEKTSIPEETIREVSHF